MLSCLRLTDGPAEAQGSVRWLPGQDRGASAEEKTHPNRPQHGYMSYWLMRLSYMRHFVKFSTVTISLELPAALWDQTTHCPFEGRGSKFRGVQHLRKLVRSVLTTERVLSVSLGQKLSRP